MSTKKNNKELNNNSSSEKTKKETGTKEKFDTGSHTPSSLRNVGPGYDDTGMSYEKSKEVDAKDPQNKKQRKPQK